jgi:hypothetical protein
MSILNKSLRTGTTEMQTTPSKIMNRNRKTAKLKQEVTASLPSELMTLVLPEVAVRMAMMMTTTMIGRNLRNSRMMDMLHQSQAANQTRKGASGKEGRHIPESPWINQRVLRMKMFK